MCSNGGFKINNYQEMKQTASIVDGQSKILDQACVIYTFIFHFFLTSVPSCLTINMTDQALTIIVIVSFSPLISA